MHVPRDLYSLFPLMRNTGLDANAPKRAQTQRNGAMLVVSDVKCAKKRVPRVL